MKKRVSGRKFSRTTNERKQLFRNLIRSVVTKGYVETTVSKAKTIQPILDKLVTRAKENTLASMRHLLAETGDVGVARILTDLGKLFAKRPGGYLRLIRLGVRQGDNTELARLEWVEKLVIAEPVLPEKSKKVATEVKKEQKPNQTEKQKLRPKEKRK